MLLYAVASSRWVRGDGFSAGPRVIARRSEEQCSIGFQPVFIHTIERCLKPWAKFFSPFGALKHPKPALFLAPFRTDAYV
jgi:hypothetical protein